MKHITPEMVKAFKARFHDKPGEESYDAAVAAGLVAALAVKTPHRMAIDAFNLAAQNTWLKARLAALQLPAFLAENPKDVEQYLTDCGMPDAAPVEPVGWWYEDKHGCIIMSLDLDLAIEHEAAGNPVSYLFAGPEAKEEVIARLTKLRQEYRPTMDQDILHSWAVDVVETLKGMQP